MKSVKFSDKELEILITQYELEMVEAEEYLKNLKTLLEKLKSTTPPEITGKRRPGRPRKNPLPFEAPVEEKARKPRKKRGRKPGRKPGVKKEMATIEMVKKAVEEKPKPKKRVVKKSAIKKPVERKPVEKKPVEIVAEPVVTETK